MKKVLDRYGVQYSEFHAGWQQVRCLNTAGHSHGDSNPSASVNLVAGKYTCFACGIKGDGFDLLLILEGVKAVEAGSDLAQEGAGGGDDAGEKWLTWR